MLNRIITGLILAGFFIFILVYFNPFLLALVFSLISIQAYNEWLTVSQVGKKDRYKLLFLLVFFMFIFILFFSSHTYIVIINSISLIFWNIILIDLIGNFKITKNIIKKGSNLLGLVMILFTWFLLISFASTSTASVTNANNYLLFSHTEVSNLNYYYIFLISLISMTDISGYFVGRNFGNKLLCQSISPKKTIEGLIASILIPLSISYLIFIYYLSIPILVSDIIFMVLCCIFCTVGDLFISVFKRHHNVKDMGNILPGHGGLLDRIDSYLPVVAIIQFWLFL
jgi:phosphatidate cytidylyltransferase